MCTPTEHIVEGILKYSIIPFAQSNNIEIHDLISELYKYHQNLKSKEENSIENTTNTTNPPNTTNTTNTTNNKQEIKEPKRGRPKGSKNKSKSKPIIESTTIRYIQIKKPKRGRPKGSTKKSNVDYIINN